MDSENGMFKDYEISCKKAYTEYLYSTSYMLESGDENKGFNKYVTKMRQSFNILSNKFHGMISKRTDKLGSNDNKKVTRKYDIKNTSKKAKKNLDDGMALINEIKGGKINDKKIRRYCSDAKLFVAANGANITSSSIALADIIQGEKEIKHMEKVFDNALKTTGTMQTNEQRSSAKIVIDNMKQNITTCMRLVKVSSNDFK